MNLIHKSPLEQGMLGVVVGSQGKENITDMIVYILFVSVVI
jgi:hypothetical protein